MKIQSLRGQMLLMLLIALVSNTHAQGVLDRIKGVIERPSPYPLLRSDYIVHDANGSVHWLDNNRILFRSVKRGEALEHGIWIWDVKKNSVTRYATIARYSTFCFARGYIYYTLNDPRRINGRLTEPEVIRKGLIGQEQESQTPPDEMMIEAHERERKSRPINRISCKEHLALTAEQKASLGVNAVFSLMDGDGMLDIGSDFQAGFNPANDKRPIRWFPSPSDPSISLEMPRCTVYSGNIKYIEHLRGYLFYQSTDCTGRKPWPIGTVRQIRVLKPSDRKIERYDLVADDKMRWGSPLTITKNGMVFSGTDNNRNLDIYLKTTGKAQKIASGYATELITSPDGCQVAAIAAGQKSDGFFVVNVCKGSK